MSYAAYTHNTKLAYRKQFYCWYCCCFMFVSAPAFSFLNAIPPQLIDHFTRNQQSDCDHLLFSSSCQLFLHGCDAEKSVCVVDGMFSSWMVSTSVCVFVFNCSQNRYFHVEKKPSRNTSTNCLESIFVRSSWTVLYSILNWLDIRTYREKKREKSTTNKLKIVAMVHALWPMHNV